MKLGVLFSGGKDSTYALFKAMEKDKVVCLISIVSKNKESYMFHTPNINLAEMQAKAIGLPLIQKTTKGEKEKELKELKKAIKEAKVKFDIEGVVAGAVESVYQATRIQIICDDLGLWCFNPLWKKNQEELLRELLAKKFDIIISGIFAYPLVESWLGKKINKNVVNELIKLKEKYKISPTGEGGEIETTVLNGPIFKKKIEIIDSEIEAEKHSGVFVIKKTKLIKK